MDRERLQGTEFKLKNTPRAPRASDVANEISPGQYRSGMTMSLTPQLNKSNTTQPRSRWRFLYVLTPPAESSGSTPAPHKRPCRTPPDHDRPWTASGDFAALGYRAKIKNVGTPIGGTPSRTAFS